MYYLAYGSNMHPGRLAGRVEIINVVGTVRLDGYKLVFQKRSNDGSAKCHLERVGGLGEAYGAVFEMSDDQLRVLDRFEGAGLGYRREQWEILVHGRPLSVVVYLASESHLALDLEPYDWYKRIVLAGARWHGFPEDYISEISLVASKVDMESSRGYEMEALLKEIEGG